ncbi:hypothetical protein E2C01_025985 [Portunus trituberculatus]|uniref:Uncharacterized protein n=1 Tax=Portunus trituberculatus TaxID=210409 RepID=A0A5B7EEC5_PORTR|nr:hypothetical protein [Portunus trituberculatus]
MRALGSEGSPSARVRILSTVRVAECARARETDLEDPDSPRGLTHFGRHGGGEGMEVIVFQCVQNDTLDPLDRHNDLGVSTARLPSRPRQHGDSTAALPLHYHQITKALRKSRAEQYQPREGRSYSNECSRREEGD